MILLGVRPATTHCLFPCLVFFSCPNSWTGLTGLSRPLCTLGDDTGVRLGGRFICFEAPVMTHCLLPCLVIVSRPTKGRGLAGSSRGTGLTRLTGFGEINITSVSLCGGTQTLFLDALALGREGEDLGLGGTQTLFLNKPSFPFLLFVFLDCVVLDNKGNSKAKAPDFSI